jgi:hypothetical protein
MKQKNEFKVKYLLKGVLILLFIVVGEVFASAKNCDGIEQVTLNVKGVDPTQGNGEESRAPMQPPHVFIDGHTLLMQYVPFDVTLEILDGSGSVAYTTFVAACTPSVTLPSTLSGDYQIRLIEGYWYFYGWIHL